MTARCGCEFFRDSIQPHLTNGPCLGHRCSVCFPLLSRSLPPFKVSRKTEKSLRRGQKNRSAVKKCSPRYPCVSDPHPLAQQCRCSILRVRSCRWPLLCGAFHPCRTAPALLERQATATPGKKELIFSEWHNLANDNCDFCLGCGVKSEG